MKNLLLTLLIFVMQSIPSYGNPNNKGIICEWIDGSFGHLDPRIYVQISDKGVKKPSETAFSFENDKVTFLIIEKKFGNIDYVRLYNEDFFSENNYIEWGAYSPLLYRYRLNRKNLILQKIFTDLKGKRRVGITRQCSVFSSEEFFKNLDTTVSKYQSKSRCQSCENKI